MSEAFENYAAAASAFRQAVRTMQSMVDVVSSGAPKLAKWREIDLGTLKGDAGAEPRLSVWPSGDQLKDGIEAVRVARQKLQQALAAMPQAQLSVIKTPETIETEALAR